MLAPMRPATIHSCGYDNGKVGDNHTELDDRYASLLDHADLNSLTLYIE